MRKFSFILLPALLITSCIQDKRPKAPTNLVATQIYEGDRLAVSLSFDDNSDNEESFLVYRNGELVGTAYANGSMKKFKGTLSYADYIDYLVVPDGIYIYQVRAMNEFGFSESNLDTIKIESNPSPSIPFCFDAIPGFHKVKLTWNDTTKRAISFQIFRNGEYIAGLESDQFMYIDSAGIDLATEYEYRIRTLVYQDSSDFATVNTKTHGEWRAIWNRSLDYIEVPCIDVVFTETKTLKSKSYELIENGFASGYNVYLIKDGLPSLIYSGPDTSFMFKRDFYPCVMAESFDSANPPNISKLTEVICAEE